jgi:hypothetical protein
MIKYYIFKLYTMLHFLGRQKHDNPNDTKPQKKSVLCSTRNKKKYMNETLYN